jgi:hypothetical protein
MSLAFQRHPPMSLRPEQHSHIAAAYDKAAFDISLPTHTRAAFAKKGRLVSSACPRWKKDRASGTRETKSPGTTTEPVWVHHLKARLGFLLALPTRPDDCTQLAP